MSEATSTMGWDRAIFIFFCSWPEKPSRKIQHHCRALLLKHLFEQWCKQLSLVAAAGQSWALQILNHCCTTKQDQNSLLLIMYVPPDPWIASFLMSVRAKFPQRQRAPGTLATKPTLLRPWAVANRLSAWLFIIHSDIPQWTQRNYVELWGNIKMGVKYSEL